jgi:adenylylsulfate kinase
MNRQPAFGVWITGLPASGKSTVAAALTSKLADLDIAVAVLESDALRKMFSSQAAYSQLDRVYFYSSLAFIGQVLTEHGVSVIFDATANRRAYRDYARHQIPRFIEVFVDCPLDICILRDPKGIYRRAREGHASDVPGLQTEYEPPEKPDVVIRSDQDEPEQAVHRILDVLADRDFLKRRG